MLTLHIRGGYDMLKKAANVIKNHKKRPLLIGVTVLTSKADKQAGPKVKKLALLAKKAGLDGIVCSPRETTKIKKVFNKKLLIVNPGIRPAGASKNDQKRITTPKEAVKNGADFIVVGRPITKAKNPALQAEKILKEIL